MNECRVDKQSENQMKRNVQMVKIM